MLIVIELVGEHEKWIKIFFHLFEVTIQEEDQILELIEQLDSKFNTLDIGRLQDYTHMFSGE